MKKAAKKKSLKEYDGEITMDDSDDVMFTFVLQDKDMVVKCLKHLGLDESKRYFDAYDFEEAFKVQLIQ